MIQRNKQHIFGEVEMHLPNLTIEEEIYFPEDRIRIIYHITSRRLPLLKGGDECVKITN